MSCAVINFFSFLCVLYLQLQSLYCQGVVDRGCGRAGRGMAGRGWGGRIHWPGRWLPGWQAWWLTSGGARPGGGRSARVRGWEAGWRSVGR